MHDSAHAVDVIDGSAQSFRWPRIPVNWSTSRQNSFQRKYFIERCFGCVMLLCFAPLIAGLWVLVRTTSRGPGFYKQLRVGLNGKCFELIKLRSMRKNAERTGEVVWCQHADQRVTLVGKYLRKLHLDELPQLWNVAKGEMVLVGPRPERPTICEKLAEKIPGYYDRNLVKPGISGLSQINLPSDQSLDDVQRKQILDLTYINETHAWFELRILVATGLRIFGLSGEAIIRLMRLSRRSLIESVEPVVPIETLSAAQQVSFGSSTIDTISESPQNEWLESFARKHLPSSVTQQQPEPSQGNTYESSSTQPVSTANSIRPVTRAPASDHTSVANCLTVDVEDYFQVSAFSDRVTRSDWNRYECRVEANTNKVLGIFDDAGVRATFFVLGWIADRYPQLVRRIAAAGHEIASHGYWHQLVYDLTPDQFADDLSASREAIYNACGVEVTSYRAPSFSIVPRSRWALDVLAELGFKTDSSIFPMSGHDRYGDPDVPKNIHRIDTPHGSLVEVPPTLGYAGRVPVPVGGGYFRFFPLRMTQRSIDESRTRVGPAMFYLHPWELDPGQPRVFADAPRKSRFRHYVGLKNTEKKLRALLATHSFDTMENVVREVMPAMPISRPALKGGTLRPVRRRSPVMIPAAMKSVTSTASNGVSV